MTSQTRASVTIATTSYDGAGNAIGVTDALGRETTSEYDAASRQLSQTLAGTATTGWTYNPTGQVLSETDPDERETTFDYDIRDRLISQTAPDGGVTEYTLDGVGNRLSKTEPEGNEWGFTWDAADRLVRVENPLEESTGYGYDPNGNLISETNARSITTTREYNSRDQLVSIEYPDGSSETYSRDANGNRTGVTTPNGAEHSMDFDAMDRLITASYGNSAAGGLVSADYVYDANGNRTEVVEAHADGNTLTSIFAYDNFNRLVAHTNGFGETITYGRDAKGNRTRRTDSTGTTRYAIDALDRVSAITPPSGRTVEYAYTAAGLVTRVTYADGLRTEQEYDDAGRLAEKASIQDGQRQAFYAYSYDKNGNRTEQIEDLGAGEVETSYDFDAVDRLIESSRAGRTTTYVLDANGNRTEKRVSSGGDTTVETYTYNQRDQLTQVAIDGAIEVEYTYDANGNRIAAAREGVIREFTFSTRNRLLSLNLQGAPPEIEWRYDDAGFRIEQTTPTEARRFHWDGDKLRLETNVLGNELIQFLHGPDRLLSETQANATRNWLTDGMRTPVKRLNTGGTVYGFTHYDEFGLVEEENNPDTPRFGFTGHQRGPEQEPELYYAQQRWYNASAGRFLSHDPLWGELTQPMSRHRYLYAYANPTVYWDPDGRLTVLKDFAESLGSLGEAAIGMAEGGQAQTANAPWYRIDQKLRGSAAVGLGAAGYVASLAGQGVVEGANIGANATVTAADTAATKLGAHETVFSPLRQQADTEFEGMFNALFSAAENPGATASAIGAGMWASAQAAAGGNVRAAIDTAMNLDPRQLIRSGARRNMSGGGDGRPEPQRIVEQGDTDYVLDNLIASEQARNASRFAVHRGFEAAHFGDVSTAPNTAVFFSGRSPSGLANAARAKAHAEATGGTILNDTDAGRYIDSLNLYPAYIVGADGRPNPRYGKETNRVWEIASGRYARGASGDVHAFVDGARSDRVYHQIERPILIEKTDVNLIEK